MKTQVRVWLTRSEDGNQAWYAKVRASGFLTQSFAALQYGILFENREQVLAGLQAADWVAFTSPRGVWALGELGLEPEEGSQLACVGAATGAACEEAFRTPNLVAKQQTGRSLAEDLMLEPAWQSVAWVGAQSGLAEISEVLETGDKELRALPVYINQRLNPTQKGPDIRPTDAVFLASPSAWNGLNEQTTVPASARLISIGPSTSAAIRGSGFQVAAEAETRDVEGMLSALHQFLNRNQPN